MTEYRVYSLDNRGLIGFAEHIIASDDRHATSQIKDVAPNAVQWELWQDRRLVAEHRLLELAE